MRREYPYWMSIMVGAFLMIATQSARAQRIQPQPNRQAPPVAPDDAGPSSDQTRKMLKASHAQLQKDVQRLFDLAAELKDEVTNSDEDVFSLSGVKKAEEIEKLSKKIQGRMKNL